MTDRTATQDRTDIPAHPSPDGCEASQGEGSVDSDLVAVLRSVNAAVVSASTREELAERVCTHLSDSPRHRAACLCDRPTCAGQSDNWTVAGAEPGDVPALPDDRFAPADAEAAEPGPSPVSIDAGQTGWWTVFPLTYHGTVYGAFGVLSSRQSLPDRERTVLQELGTVIGHAITAVETRRLLAAPAVVEIELVSSDTTHPLVAAATQVGCRFTLDGLLPTTGSGGVAYLTVENASVAAASEHLTGSRADDVTVVTESPPGEGTLAWRLTTDTVLGQFRAHGAQVTDTLVTGERARYTAELAAGSDVRSVLQSVRERFPDTRLRSKRELERPVQPPRLTDEDLASLTDRQRSVMEAAFHAGYYRWPRAATAEEVAATLDISAATLHGHLRKAEHKLLDELFGTGPRPIRDGTR